MKALMHLLALAGLLALPCGCSQDPNGGGAGPDTDQGAGPSGGAGPAAKGFEKAEIVSFRTDNRIILNGTISAPGEVDSYDIGGLSAGDFVEIIAVTPGDSALDPMIALFDGHGNRVLWDDDIDPGSSNYHSAFDGSIRHDSARHYLSITHSSFAASTGAYRVTVQLHRGVAVAPTIGQVFVLQFGEVDGAAVAGVDYGALPAFDAAAIHAAFAGRTAEMQQRITALVQADFQSLDVTILTSDDPAPAGNYSSVYFGSTSGQGILGTADEVDFFNGSDQDDCIVFVADFASISSNFEGIAQAIANVVSREMGRTLGLMYTAGDGSLMDHTAENTALLDDLTFGKGALLSFPVGTQDAMQLLTETVGSN